MPRYAWLTLLWMLALVAMPRGLRAQSTGMGIEVNQSRPKRPLVISPNQVDLFVGIASTLVRVEPDDTLDVGAQTAVPIGVDVGVGNHVEVGGLLNLALHPEVQSTLTLRTRIDLGLKNRALALGLITTLPLGSVSWRLGPEKIVPLALELPAFRLEGGEAALQGVLRWQYQLQEGPDSHGVEAAIAGIVRIHQQAFAAFDLSISGPDYDFGGAPIHTGGALGYRFTDAFVGKIVAQNADLVEFSPWQFMVLIVNSSGGSSTHTGEWD